MYSCAPRPPPRLPVAKAAAAKGAAGKQPRESAALSVPRPAALHRDGKQATHAALGLTGAAVSPSAAAPQGRFGPQRRRHLQGVPTYLIADTFRGARAFPFPALLPPPPAPRSPRTASGPRLPPRPFKAPVAPPARAHVRARGELASQPAGPFFAETRAGGGWAEAGWQPARTPLLCWARHRASGARPCRVGAAGVWGSASARCGHHVGRRHAGGDARAARGRRGRRGRSAGCRGRGGAGARGGAQRARQRNEAGGGGTRATCAWRRRRGRALRGAEAGNRRHAAAFPIFRRQHASRTRPHDRTCGLTRRSLAPPPRLGLPATRLRAGGRWQPAGQRPGTSGRATLL